jgi:hypothetical protein
MSGSVALAVSGRAVATALYLSFHALARMTRQQVPTEAGQITRLLSSAGARAKGNPGLGDKSLRHKLSQASANFGAPNALAQFAASLVSAYRIARLENR